MIAGAVPLYPFERWLDNVGLAALSTRRTLDDTWELARSVCRDGVPGDFAEAGVFAGAQVAVMMRVAQSRGRRVHAFDNFSGVPAGGAEDAGWTHEAGVSACPRNDFERNLMRWSLNMETLVCHVGDFADTVRRASFTDGLCMLRIDGDLYRSTHAALQLVEAVNPGGIVVIDDFDLAGCRQAVCEAMDSRRLATGPITFRKQGSH